MQRTAFVLLLLVPAFAGCLSGDDGGPAWFGRNDPGLQPADHPMPFGRNHDHADPNQHRFADQAELLDTDNLQRFGWNPNSHVVGAHAITIHEDRMAVAVFGNHDATGGQQGFHLFDISDPEDLQHLSFWQAGTAVGGDRTIAFSPDGQTVFLGFERGNRPGVAAVDVSDPTNPHEVAFWTDICIENPADRPPNFPVWRTKAGCYGPHTVAAGQVGEDTYVFVVNIGVTILRFTGGSLDEVVRYHSPEQMAVLGSAQQFDPEEIEPNQQDVDRTALSSTSYAYAYHTIYAHDASFYHDPVTDKPLLLIAYAFDGVKVVDLSNPQTPVLQASWVPDSDLGINHYVHAFTAERLDSGEFILVAGTEAAYEEHTEVPSPLWVLDGTGMIEGGPMETPMELLGAWQNPDGAPAEGLTNSMHWHRQQDGLLYVSHYHGGVWAIDLRTEADRVRPEHFGYIMPLPADAQWGPEWLTFGGPVGAPFVFDVDVDRHGNVYAADIVQGVSSIRFQVPGE